MMACLSKTKLSHGIVVFSTLFLLSGNATYGFNNTNQIINLNQCANCHGGGQAPALAANAGGFTVIDTTTGMQATQYTAGRAYTIRIQFQGQNIGGNYRNAYVLSVNSGSFTSTAGIGLVSGLRNARIVTSTSATTANMMDVPWTAPASGSVSINLLRMETNNNGSTNGDRNSQSLENISLTQAGVTAPPPADNNNNSNNNSSQSNGSTSQTSGSSNTNADGSSDESSSADPIQNFSTIQLGGGCGFIHGSSSLKDQWFSAVMILVLSLFTWGWRRKAAVRQNKRRQ